MRQDSNIRQQERNQNKEMRDVPRGRRNRVSGDKEQVKPE